MVPSFPGILQDAGVPAQRDAGSVRTGPLRPQQGTRTQQGARTHWGAQQAQLTSERKREHERTRISTS